jgi:hypothetical protein
MNPLDLLSLKKPSVEFKPQSHQKKKKEKK